MFQNTNMLLATEY